MATTPDSLERVLQGHMHDTLRVMRMVDLANLYRTSNPPRAKELLRQAYVLATAADYQGGTMRVLNGMGMLLLVEGNQGDAIRHYLGALDIANKNNFNKAKILMYGNIGILYDELKDSEDALYYFRLSVAESRRLGMRQPEANGLNNIGVVLLRLGQTDSAMSYLARALAIKHANKDSMGMALTLNHIAKGWSRLQQPDSALRCIRQSLVMSRATNNVHQKLNSHALLAEVLLGMGQKDSARWYAQQSLAGSRAVGYNERIIQALEVSASVARAEGKPELALAFLEEKMHISDSLAAENSRAIAANLKDDLRLRNSVLTLKSKSQRQSEVMGWLIAGVVLLVLMGAGLVMLIASRTRANTRLQVMRRELQTLNLELEHRVKERTAQLEARNTQLEAYAHHTSHRLRAPLATLLGLIDVLKLYAIPANIQRHIDGIDQSAQALDEVVHDINDSLSKDTNG